MSGKPTISGIICKEYLGRYAGKDSRWIARTLRKDHPKVFRSIDHARTVVRYYRGRLGKYNAGLLADQRFALPEPTEDNPYSMPASLMEPWLPYVIPDDRRRIAVMGDVHVPFHDMRALSAALKYVKEQEVDTIILNGDIADCYALSSFEKNPEKRHFPGEVEAVRHFGMSLRNMFPDALIIYKEGNHEERFEKLLTSKAPDLLGCAEFSLRVLFDLHNLGFEWVTDKRPMQYRGVDILHGQELPCRSGGVNPARSSLLKCRSNVIVSHFHRKTNDLQKTLRGELLQAWSVGCLSELSPRYMPINDWAHGVLLIRNDDSNDKWSVDNKTIIGGEIV